MTMIAPFVHVVGKRLPDGSEVMALEQTNGYVPVGAVGAMFTRHAYTVAPVGIGVRLKLKSTARMDDG